MLLVLEDDHKEHLAFLTKVELSGEYQQTRQGRLISYLIHCDL